MTLKNAKVDLIATCLVAPAPLLFYGVLVGYTASLVGRMLLTLIFLCVSIIIYSMVREEVDKHESRKDINRAGYEYMPSVKDIISKINNEMSVVAAFAGICNHLGYSIAVIGTRFPDATIRNIETGELLRAEFEFKSSSFRAHGHDPSECDILICWEHNWRDCPLPVIELREKW